MDPFPHNSSFSLHQIFTLRRGLMSSDVDFINSTLTLKP